MANRISTNAEEPGHYFLEGMDVPVSIRYNESTNSLRLQIGTEQRLFFLEHEAHSQRVYLSSEYGIRCGSCRLDDLQAGAGTVRYEDSKFRFRRQEQEVHVQRDHHPETATDWLFPDPIQPEAFAGILMMLCRMELKMQGSTA